MGVHTQLINGTEGTSQAEFSWRVPNIKIIRAKITGFEGNSIVN